MSVLIVGYGIVGHNLNNEIQILKPDIYDKYHLEYNSQLLNHYDFCFICVDTPQTENSLCDITEIKNVLHKHQADVYIIKSAILPGTVEKLKKEFNKHIIVSPEYYGNTQHCNNYSFNFTILGGEKSDCIQVQQLLQNVYDASHTFHITDSRTAELVKYMENAFLGTKVAFCAQFFEIAQKFNINYEELRELFILDPRINASHTFIYREHPYYDSHCLNKDIPAIAELGQAQLLKNIIAFNNLQKQLYKIKKEE